MTRKALKPSPILHAATAIISTASERLVTKDSQFRHTFEASVDQIHPDPDQPRKHFDEAALQTLADTMQAQGQLQPVLLRRHLDKRGSWIVVAGERRWRAAKLIGWTSLLAIEHDGDPEVATLLENMQRVDLSPVEEARGLEQLIAGKGWTQAEAGGALGRSKAEISAALRILSLPDDLLGAILMSELSLPRNVLVELARVDDAKTQNGLIALARAGGLTIRAIRESREPASPAAAREQPVTRSAAFSIRTVDKVTTGLQKLGQSGRPLRQGDRQSLLRLRAVVDELLQ